MGNNNYANGMNNNSRTSLSDIAYSELKDHLPKIPDGSYISIRQFARGMGMSYTPVREAFLRAEQEGILRLVPNVGFFVETTDLTELIQIFQVRECLEVFILDQVFDQITTDHIEKMKKINLEQYEALSKGDFQEYHRLDLEFHEVTFQLYGNKYLLDFYKNIRQKFTIVSLRIGKALSDEAYIEHSQYFMNLEAGNKKQAMKELRKHIHMNKERMKEGYINVLNQM